MHFKRLVRVSIESKRSHSKLDEHLYSNITVAALEQVWDSFGTPWSEGLVNRYAKVRDLPNNKTCKTTVFQIYT